MGTNSVQTGSGAVLEGMNDRYRFLEERTLYKRAIGERLKQKTLFTPRLLEQMAGVGTMPGLSELGDYYSALENSRNVSLNQVTNTTIHSNVIINGGQNPLLVVRGEKGEKGDPGIPGREGRPGRDGIDGKPGRDGIDGKNGKDASLKDVKDFIRKYNKYKKNAIKNTLMRFAKWTGIATLGVGALAGAYYLFNSKKSENVANAEGIEAQKSIPFKPLVEEDSKGTNLQLNKDGTYTTIYGDSFYTIAERYLADKYINEPEKFANLSGKEKDAMILNEAKRLVVLNGYKMDENNYFTIPPLLTDVNIKVE